MDRFICAAAYAALRWPGPACVDMLCHAIKGVLPLLAAMFMAPLQAGNSDSALSGLWQHESKPVVVKMRSFEGLTQGIIASHTNKPGYVGKNLFRDLAQTGQTATWQGRVYVQELGEEKDVRVTLINPDQFVMVVKVGFISRKVSWHRSQANTADAQHKPLNMGD